MLKVSKQNLVLISTLLIVISFITKEISNARSIAVGFMLMTTFIAGTPVFLKAFSALRYRIVGIDALVTIAVVGALFIGETWEAAAVTYLFMLGDYLESRTIEKTRSSIKKLLDLSPKKTIVVRHDLEVEIMTEDVLKGDWVIVKPGEKISVDGLVFEGSAYVDQSSITGESLPVLKTKDESVFSGTILESGYLKILAEKVGEDTTFAKILRLVEEAQDSKAKTQKFIEKFSRYYTPLVVLLAIIMFIITRDLELSLTILVIACPGALVISTPVSIVAGIGSGAKHRILFKGGESIEKLAKVNVVAFDKTGTLTIGKPQVTKIQSFGLSDDEVLRIAAIGESYSEHPLGKAIINKAVRQFGQLKETPFNAEMLPGQGVTFTINNISYALGNRNLLQQHKIDLSNFESIIAYEEENGQTVMILSDYEKVLGLISVADTLRPEAKALVKKLKSLGIKKVVMLTGDNQRTAQSIAKEVGINEVYGNLLPSDKVNVLKQLQKQYGLVAMVGDGVNDAPALATSDLGIAMGGAGSDVAMETADVILLSSEIRKLVTAFGLSKATVSNMQQNILFALFVAGTLLTGVLIKTINLSIGMLIHEISVFLVIINAARLLRYKESSQNKV
ncbi:MAG: Cd2+/Zn2+-exporting ATPase [Erysipelotrichaceae bacterium]|nr:MAG: Cd2+/Zn2+-exporting [Erysipelotrichaceae bacterium]TXT16305.1 MAG: Cd2+/Zn2+-exporting ATPase [Erysipelotrichaceae bacterium]